MIIILSEPSKKRHAFWWSFCGLELNTLFGYTGYSSFLVWFYCAKAYLPDDYYCVHELSGNQCIVIIWLWNYPEMSSLTYNSSLVFNEVSPFLRVLSRVGRLCFQFPEKIWSFIHLLLSPCHNKTIQSLK